MRCGPELAWPPCRWENWRNSRGKNENYRKWFVMVQGSLSLWRWGPEVRALSHAGGKRSCCHGCRSKFYCQQGLLQKVTWKKCLRPKNVSFSATPKRRWNLFNVLSEQCDDFRSLTRPNELTIITFTWLFISLYLCQRQVFPGWDLIELLTFAIAAWLHFNKRTWLPACI